jgi:hypothetical protein
MGTATQYIWSATSGLFLVPRGNEGTARPFSQVETTGAQISYATCPPPMVSGEEQEWAVLLASERKALAKRRIKPGAVNKAIREVRYGK